MMISKGINRLMQFFLFRVALTKPLQKNIKVTIIIIQSLLYDEATSQGDRKVSDRLEEMVGGKWLTNKRPFRSPARPQN